MSENDNYENIISLEIGKIKEENRKILSKNLQIKKENTQLDSTLKKLQKELKKLEEEYYKNNNNSIHNKNNDENNLEILQSQLKENEELYEKSKIQIDQSFNELNNINKDLQNELKILEENYKKEEDDNVVLKSSLEELKIRNLELSQNYNNIEIIKRKKFKENKKPISLPLNINNNKSVLLNLIIKNMESYKEERKIKIKKDIKQIKDQEKIYKETFLKKSKI